MADLSLSQDEQSPAPAAPAAPAADTGDLGARLRSALQELDLVRVGQRGEFVFRIAVAVMGAGALAMVSGLAMVGVLGRGLQDLNVLIYALPPLAAAGLLGYWATLPRRHYMSTYKSEVLPAVAAALGDFHYDPAGKIGTQMLTGSTLLPPHEEYRSEDMFFGHYKGVEIALAEVKLTREQGSGRERKTITAFKGLFALLSTQRAISGKTVIRRQYEAAANWLGGTFGGLEQVVPEDLAFDSRFDVYSSDWPGSRHLLTPAFLERLTALASHAGSGGLQAAFYEDQIFIMVPNTRDLFEPPSIFTSMLKDTGIGRVAGEFRDVLSMVDDLTRDEATVS